MGHLARKHVQLPSWSFKTNLWPYFFIVLDQKVKDPCVCDKTIKKQCKEGTKKSKCTEKCSSQCNTPCKENKDCKDKDQPKKCPRTSQADEGKKCKSIKTSEGAKKCNCNCKCKEGEAKQAIPKPGAAVSGALQPVTGLSAQHGIGKKVNSSKKCCCDCCHDCCCDCCHDCCDCCHDCCHDCCCHDCHCCCEPCCCCHCCEPCCCCCHECCCPCCHCCHCCHHCPCCCGCGCGCCKKSKAQLNSAALAAAAAAAASRPEHHWSRGPVPLLKWLKLILAAHLLYLRILYLHTFFHRLVFAKENLSHVNHSKF